MDELKLEAVRKVLLILGLVCIGAFLLLALSGIPQTAGLVIFAIAMVCLVGILVVKLAFWRCPNCGRCLGRDVNQHCTHCGEKLDLPENNWLL